jgi:GT2 family glycosyltransferase
LEKCVKSLITYTNLENIEIIVVANGAETNTKGFINGLNIAGIPIRCLWYDNPIGAVPALNAGIREAKGDYIVLLNDDCEILPSVKNFWIEALIEPFSDPLVAVTGPFRMQPTLGPSGNLSLSIEDAIYGFIVFFCAVIRKDIFDKHGILDETLSCGVDIDFCMKLKRNGYKIVQVPEERLDDSGTHITGSFPLWHQGEGTVHDFYTIEKWHEMIAEDVKILESRYGTKKYTKVSIIIPTFGDNLKDFQVCLDSVIENTNLSRSADVTQCEIIVVANGCPETVRKYVESKINLPITLLWYPEPTGFPFAANEGVKVASGEIIVFLNHDVIIINDLWLPMLIEPFKNKEVGMTGPIKGWNSEVCRHFIIFFCCAIRRQVFDDIGMVDDIFSPGGFEDVDFSIKAENAGWLLSEAPEGAHIEMTPEFQAGIFPIYHKENHKTWMTDEVFNKNRQIILDRYANINPLKETIKVTWPCAQKPTELSMLQEFLKRIKIKKLLEVGTYRGGSAMLWAHLVEPWNGKVYCVDLKFDWGAFWDFGYSGDNYLQYRRQIYNDTPYEKYITELQGDSHDPDFVKFVHEQVGEVDVLFIDGDHSKEGVKRDFEAFSPLVRKGGYIIFHDIVDSEHHKRWGCYVADFWQELKKKYHYWEFIDNNEYTGSTHRSMGIGVILKDDIPIVEYIRGKDVTAEISTKDRYNTTLPLAISAIINQTVKPKKLLIYDDGEQIDLREVPVYNGLFNIMNRQGIIWEVHFGERKGQVLNHQKALTEAGTPFIWRVDDDDIPEANVLSGLLDFMTDDAGAVGGLILHPQMHNESKLTSSHIEDIFWSLNKQWFKGSGGDYEVDHLNNSFLFRVEAAMPGYCMELSPVGHREETIFTYEMKRRGWKIILNEGVTTWHLKEMSGGIRAYSDGANWQRDEEVFKQKLSDWGIVPTWLKLVVLDNGLGDHLMFKQILNEIKEKHKDKKIALAVCYPEVFEDEKDVIITSIADAHTMVGDDIEKCNIYKYAWDIGLNDSFINAYRRMYL